MGLLIGDLSRNSLWHAFDALDTDQSGCVPKSRLLVLSASLGNLLGVKNVEKGLKEHRSTPYLKFPEFMFYLEKELFASLPREISAESLKKILYNIDDMCWLVCKNSFYVPEKSQYPEDYYFRIFCIFCAVAEYSLSPSKESSVTLCANEIQQLSEMYDSILGNDIEILNYKSELDYDKNVFSLRNWFSFMEKQYVCVYEKDAILEATEEIFDTVVENVIKKGFLKKWLTPLGPSVKMWFVLKQHSLIWYSNKGKKDLWGEVHFHGSEVEVQNGPGTQFSIITASKGICLSATDCSTKLQWMAAVNVALMHSQTLEPLQRLRFAKRRQLRKEAEIELEKEKQVLMEKEAALSTQLQERLELELQLQRETERLKDMELKEKILLIQLEEERRAKRDEEVVRNLQSRMLAEEWEKREELEKLQVQKDAELIEEKRLREQLEVWQRKRLAEIEELNTVVSSLEREKEQLHGTLKKTKMLFREPQRERPKADTQKNLKRSLSADLSEMMSDKWSVPAISNDENKY